MKKVLLSLSALFLAAAASAQTAYKLQPNVAAKDYMANTIIFKVKETLRSSCTEQGVNIPSLQKSFNTVGITSVNKIFKNEQAPREKFNKYGQPLTDLSLIYECKFSGSAKIEKVINALLASNALAYAEPHFIPVTTYTPNDPQATPSLQYHINRIDAYTGWNTSKGDTNVIIGITDTGTDPTHSDLQGNIKHNYADPINGIDDDLDGYVDNFSGWDLGVNDNDPTWQGNQHGVHVCGIAAASTDNAIGVAGIGFKSKFLPVKIADATGALIAAYEGIKYAADHGCKVINCSWGGTGGGQYGQDICNYAIFNKDAMVVIAAGNTGFDQLFYPAAYNNVMAVANTQSNDIINNSSTYGYFVDVSAPGTNINSTWPGNSYTQQTGTSMASPVTAGVVAIVRSFYPSYSAIQAKERVKQTTDNIYSLPINNGRIDKLGTGRVNLKRALTDPLAPAVIYDQLIITDKNDDIFNLNDTIRIGGLFTNYLAPTTALTATLIPITAGVTPLNNNLSLGAISMMGSVSNTATPFQFKLTSSFAPNTVITFSLVMQDGSYTGRDVITVLANRDYINIAENDISTTATSKGKTFNSGAGQADGLGFTYLGTNLIYDGGLMIGVDTNRVSDVIRGTGATNDADFKISTNIYQVITSPKSLMDTYAKYSDSASASIIGIEIEQRTYVWNSVPDKKYVIWEYVIKNNSTTTYTSMYAGVCADWDIDNANYATDKSAYDATNKMGYSWSTLAGGKYAGIKLLTSFAPPNFYALDNVAGGCGGYDIASASGFPTSTKYKTLSQNRLTAGSCTVSGTGNDVVNVMSSGPYTVAPGQYAVVAFALMGGDSLLDLQNSAAAAQIKYATVAATGVGVKEISLAANSVLVYPNPATDKIYVTIKNKTENDLFVYDVNGKLVYENKNSSSFSIDTEKWNRGIYFIKISNKDGVSTSKIVLQ
ncbi:MAG TPA: S8/S53 family peptidase [Bacteroidia bacterium]|jgi:serine protease|nr:S8/S53 family peptidase [Bacteroidia bacterium]